eukprot:12096919-Ditylum_brightwellii.AAC.1
MYQKLSIGLKKCPKNSTTQQLTTGVLKKARCQQEKTAKRNAAVRQLPNLLPPSPQHDTNNEKEEE